MNINKCIFAGNLTRDPEARTTGTGKNVTNFSLAINNPRSRDREETLFIKCEAWGKTGEIAEQYLRKGSNCCVDGRVRLEEYTTRDGDKRTDLILVVNDLILGARPRDDQGGGGGGGYDRGGSSGGGYDRDRGSDRGGYQRREERPAPPARDRDTGGGSAREESRHYEPTAGEDAEDDLPF